MIVGGGPAGSGDLNGQKDGDGGDGCRCYIVGACAHIFDTVPSDDAALGRW